MTAPTSPGVVPADVRELVERLRRNAATFNRNGFAVSEARAITEAADMLERLANRPSLVEAERQKAMDEVAPILESHDGFPEWAMIHFPTGAVRVLCGLSRWPYAMHKARRALADRSEPRQEKEGKA